MKLFFSIGLLLASLSVFSQKNETAPSLTPTFTNTLETNIPGKVLNAKEAHSFLQGKFDYNSDLSISLNSEIPSLSGMHYTYTLSFKGYEIDHAYVKINTDEKGNILSLFSPNIDIQSSKNIQVNPELMVVAEKKINGDLKESKMKWVWINENFELCYSIQYLDLDRNFQETLFNQALEVVAERNLNQHFHEADSVAKGLVFQPNPLVSAETTYGGAYVDNNDATSPELDAERDTVNFFLNYDNGVFVLENDYLKIVNVSPPNVLPAESNTPFFYFNRSEDGFEDVNAFYHITTYQEYLQQLGFTNLVDYRIDVDCHGLNGADNSLFNSGTNPPSIIFGEGGVDDAEDADVIIHEYTHAIMESASPNTNFGTERGAMDEAFGDYLAVSYSKSMTSFQDNWVYRWDGHNEFWDGREVVSQKMYPDALQYHIYADAPLWSAALMQIERNLGRELTNTIALEAAYSYTANMEMSQAAALFLTTDDQLNNGVNKNTMCWVFKDRGMLDQCPGSRPNNLVGLNEPIASNSISIINSEAFYLGTGNLIIESSTPFEILVFDLSGKLQLSQSITKTYTEISPEDFQSGAYILKVVNKLETKTLKIIHQ